MSFKGTLASSIISIAASWVIKALGLISTLILARLLTPEDFGLVAICILVIYFFELFSATGTRAYILSLDEVSLSDINCAWTLDFLAKSVITLLVILLSPAIADYFNNSELAVPIAVSAFIPFITAMENPKINLLRRNLEYAPIFRISIAAKIISFIVTITLAFYLRSFWALIIGSITSATCNTLLGYFLYPYPPKFQTSNFKKQWQFSKWIFSKAFVGYARAKADTFILAKFFTLSNVGYFNIAKELGMLVYEQIALPISDVIMSGIKNAGNEIEVIALTIEKYLVVLISIIFPASIGIILLSHDLVLLLLGEKWIKSSELLKPLAIFGFFVGITAVLTSSLNSLRKVKSTFYLESAIAVFAVIILFIFREATIIDFSIIVAIIGLITFLSYLSLMRFFIPIRLYSLLVGLIPTLVSTLFMSFCINYVGMLLGFTLIINFIIKFVCN